MKHLRAFDDVFVNMCISMIVKFVLQLLQNRLCPGVGLSAVLTLANARKEYNFAEFIEIMQVSLRSIVKVYCTKSLHLYRKMIGNFYWK